MFRALFKLVLVVRDRCRRRGVLPGVVVVRHASRAVLAWPTVRSARRGRLTRRRLVRSGRKWARKQRSAAAEAQAALAQGSLTAKIKSKMALDDLVRARSINVDTSGGVATLTGTVSSEAERQRALQLARETNGVTTVVDRLVVRVETRDGQPGCRPCRAIGATSGACA